MSIQKNILTTHKRDIFSPILNRCTQDYQRCMDLLMREHYEKYGNGRQKNKVRELWNEQELHILSGSKRQFTIPRGRVMHRLLKLDGY